MPDTDPGSPVPAAWTDALAAAALLAVDPEGLRGLAIRCGAGPVRDRLVQSLRARLPVGVPWRRIPPGVPDGRLLGGLDLTATLAAGRPVSARGLLADADGGVVVLPMAERVGAAFASRLGSALDRGEIALERDGIAAVVAARVAVVALDEGDGDDERPPAALVDRLAFLCDIAAVPLRAAAEAAGTRADTERARAALPAITVSAEIVEALCAAALALGVDSARAALLALRTARAAAALAGHADVTAADAALAARLVLAPRATRVPALEGDTDTEAEAEAEAEAPEAAEPAEPQDTRDEQDEPEPLEPSQDDGATRPPADVVLEAALAALPARLLALARGSAAPPRGGAVGRAGQIQTPAKARSGRPTGAIRGDPRRGARLDVVETLRAAAPWQRLRERRGARIEVRSDDFRVVRYRHRAQTTTVFAVDASGSSAQHRLAEAKGAVELLLAECYVRRDQVALIAFRGDGAELLLPPTRSLVRAKRSLAALPGGGGTPLAAGIDAAAALAEGAARRGETPVLVLLTDGRANVARDGTHSRERAAADALAAAARVRAAGCATVLIDTSPRPHPDARALATAMNATYVPMPHAGAAALCVAVQRAT